MAEQLVAPVTGALSGRLRRGSQAPATRSSAPGRLDVLVNNAGIAVVGAVEEVTIAEAQRQFDTKLFGLLRVTQASCR
jgi:NAD(P)-dependent dehydrogenase (short-subunit alcohol dehydrogenase family)